MNRYMQYMYSYPHKTAYRALENVNVRDYFFHLEGEGHSLYLHLPFCESKCGYCNLFSVTGCGRDRIDAYLDAVFRQMKQYREMLPRSASFGDFTIGGGTPLLLAGEQIARIFEEVGTCLPMEDECQIIIETAPNQTDREKARLLKSVGVTRVSMGIQSFEEEELKWLGRKHDGRRAKEAAEMIKSTGFACVNFDFIYGLPGQTADSLTASLRTALSYSPDEIFLYPLYIKHGVRLEREGRKKLLHSDHTYGLYQCGTAYLLANGYEQISMRRFVKKEPGRASRAERLTSCGTLAETFSGSGQPEFQECGLKSALALGCGGRSYLGRLHFCTPYRTTRAGALREIDRFQQTEDFSLVSNGILLSEEELKRRYVIKHLLIRPGVSKEAYRKAFGADVLEEFPMLREWIACGWLEAFRGEQDGCHVGSNSGNVYIGLTREGLGLSDYIGPQLISEKIRERMLEWERENA